MNDPRAIEAILARFRDWLEDARLDLENHPEIETESGSDTGPSPRDFGLVDLVGEFTALRHELKLQTKSSRGLIEQTENTIAALRQAIDQFRTVEPREDQAAWTAGKGLAEALADLDEALVRGEREIDRARHQLADQSVRSLESSITGIFRGRSWIRRQFLRSYHHEVIETVRREAQVRDEVFDAFLEGYGLIQKRMRRAMASEQVMHIPCEGKPVDPELMTVIELVDGPHDQPGTVAKELRRGYTWRGRLLRFAEVQAVRGSWEVPADSYAAPRPSETFGVDTEMEEAAGDLETADGSRSGPA